jgi:hypothetical protein
VAPHRPARRGGVAIVARDLLSPGGLEAPAQRDPVVCMADDARLKDPDVLFDVPQLRVDEICFEVENLNVGRWIMAGADGVIAVRC